jgi:phosphohistidine phosphatase SixA
MKWITFTLLTLLVSTPAAAANLVLLVRHAEKAEVAGNDMLAKDPDLSSAGRKRAESLASLLKDANLTAVFSTDYKRTRMTAEPVAKEFGLTVQLYDPKNVTDLVGRLNATAGVVLVVGHSNTIPEVVKALGVGEEVTIAETDFGTLFLVDRPNTADPTFIRLRY